jgi:hypothetical protein
MGDAGANQKIARMLLEEAGAEFGSVTADPEFTHYVF